MSFPMGGGGMSGGGGGGGMMPSMNPMEGIHQMMAPLGQMLGMPTQHGTQAQPAATPVATPTTPASNNQNITSAPVGVQGLDERALIELLAQSNGDF